MAIAYVNSATSGIITSAAPATAAFVATAGNLIYCLVEYTPAGGGVGSDTISVADTAGNTYTQMGSLLSLGYSVLGHFYAMNISGHASNVVTATLSGTRTGSCCMCAQFSGLHTSTPLDATATGSNTSGSTLTSGTFNTDTADELICAGANNYYLGAWSAGNIGGVAATLAINSVGVVTGSAAIEYRIVAATQSGITAAISASGTLYGHIGVASFRIAAAAGPVIPVFMVQYRQRWN